MARHLAARARAGRMKASTPARPDSLYVILRGVHADVPLGPQVPTGALAKASGGKKVHVTAVGLTTPAMSKTLYPELARPPYQPDEQVTIVRYEPT